MHSRGRSRETSVTESQHSNLSEAIHHSKCIKPKFSRDLSLYQIPEGCREDSILHSTKSSIKLPKHLYRTKSNGSVASKYSNDAKYETSKHAGHDPRCGTSFEDVPDPETRHASTMTFSSDRSQDAVSDMIEDAMNESIRRESFAGVESLRMNRSLQEPLLRSSSDLRRVSTADKRETCDSWMSRCDQFQETLSPEIENVTRLQMKMELMHESQDTKEHEQGFWMIDDLQTRILNEKFSLQLRSLGRFHKPFIRSCYGNEVVSHDVSQTVTGQTVTGQLLDSQHLAAKLWSQAESQLTATPSDNS